MLDIIILIVLAAGFFVGLRRGLVLQLVHFTGLIASYVLAYIYFDELAPKLKLWIPYPADADTNAFFEYLSHLNLEAAYYRAIAFVIIFIAVKIGSQIIGSMLDFLSDLPLIKTANRWLGGLFGFIEVYLVLFILLYIGALIPYLGIQEAVNQSYLAHVMIDNTPIFSEKIKELWVLYVEPNLSNGIHQW